MSEWACFQCEWKSSDDKIPHVIGKATIRFGVAKLDGMLFFCSKKCVGQWANKEEIKE